MTLYGLEEGVVENVADGLEELVALWDAVVVAGSVVVTAGVTCCAAAVEVAVEVAVAVEVGVGEADGPLNTRSRLTMRVAPPGTSKCHPSSHGGTTPSQLPVVAKVAAVIGVGVFGSSPIWYGVPKVAADPAPALAATKAPTAATRPASRHPVRRAVLLNTGFLPR
jgi:hypothetical protein